MTTTDDLITWLLAAIDADRQIARDASAGPWMHVPTRGNLSGDGVMGLVRSVVEPGDGGGIDEEDAAHVVNWHPDRVIAECEAKRKLMERGGPFCDCYGGNPPMDPASNWTVPIPHHYDCSAYVAAQVLAEPYAAAGRPGYQEAWRPE